MTGSGVARWHLDFGTARSPLTGPGRRRSRWRTPTRPATTSPSSPSPMRSGEQYRCPMDQRCNHAPHLDERNQSDRDLGRPPHLGRPAGSGGPGHGRVGRTRPTPRRRTSTCQREARCSSTWRPRGWPGHALLLAGPGQQRGGHGREPRALVAPPPGPRTRRRRPPAG